MKNWEALKALMEGKCVRQSRWGNRDFYWKPGSELSMTEFSDLALFKDGWEIYDPSHDYAWSIRSSRVILLLLATPSSGRTPARSGRSTRTRSWRPTM